jgi:hypothetical protein
VAWQDENDENVAIKSVCSSGRMRPPTHQNQGEMIENSCVRERTLLMHYFSLATPVEIINARLGTHSLEKVSAGHVVKAMILNCMGFLTVPLYLFSQFFVGKATEHLIGEGVLPEHLSG